MSRIINNDLVLTEAETNTLLSSLCHPDMEAIRKREQLLRSLDSLQVKVQNNTSIVLDIPDLLISDIVQKFHSSEQIMFKNSFLQTVEHTPVEIRYSCGSPYYDTIDFDFNNNYYCSKKNERLNTAPITPNPSGFAA